MSKLKAQIVGNFVQSVVVFLSPDMLRGLVDTIFDYLEDHFEDKDGLVASAIMSLVDAARNALDIVEEPGTPWYDGDDPNASTD